MLAISPGSAMDILIFEFAFSKEFLIDYIRAKTPAVLAFILISNYPKDLVNVSRLASLHLRGRFF